jgi:CheY-like chemotaxis protein
MKNEEAILIVDDQPLNLKLIRVILAREGYDVRTASSAEDALRMLGEFQPRLILMDLQLPGMDGLELTRILKTDNRWQGIVILAITAHAMKGVENKALAAGCDGFLSKPIDTRALPEIVARWMKHPSPGHFELTEH